MGEGLSPSIEITDGAPPVKAKKGRKSKSSLVPPAPEGSMSGSKPASETSSITGEGLSIKTGDAYDGDGTVGDDISVLSLDEGKLLPYAQFRIQRTNLNLKFGWVCSEGNA